MKREGVLTLPYQSVEDVGFRIKSPHNPTTLSAEVGLAETGEENPTSWVSASWTGEVLVDRWFATAPIGPLEKGKRYNVYVRVDGTVVLHAGAIEAF